MKELPTGGKMEFRLFKFKVVLENKARKDRNMSGKLILRTKNKEMRIP